MARGTQINKPVMKYFLNTRMTLCRNQVEVAAGAAGAGVAAEADAPPASPPLAAGAADWPAAGLPAPLLLRKSVTYQPEPLSWKPAAVTCLEYVLWPQAGQSASGASEIFAARPRHGRTRCIYMHKWAFNENSQANRRVEFHLCAWPGRSGRHGGWAGEIREILEF